MTENKVVTLREEGAIDDPLIEILRDGAKLLIARAVEAEFAAFLASHDDEALPDGRQRVVRHGHDPARVIQTGVGPVEVQKPKARDRAAPADGERIRFASSDRFAMGAADEASRLAAANPRSARRFFGWRRPGGAVGAARQGRGQSVAVGDFVQKGEWQGEYERWLQRDLSARRYVHLWADGVDLFQARTPSYLLLEYWRKESPRSKRDSYDWINEEGDLVVADIRAIVRELKAQERDCMT